MYLSLKMNEYMHCELCSKKSNNANSNRSRLTDSRNPVKCKHVKCITTG